MLEENAPDISWMEMLREKSYIFARIFTLLEQHRNFTATDIGDAAKLYEEIIRNETEDAVKNGVKILVAFHGIDEIASDASRQLVETSLDNVCSFSGFSCLSLDDHLNVYDHGEIFLADGHWNNGGHAVVAEAIGNHLFD